MDQHESSEFTKRAVATPPISLTARQHQILLKLRDMHADLALMYEGALLVLDKVQHAERLPLAAHLMRELIEKLYKRKMNQDLKAGIPQPDSSQVDKAWKAALSSGVPNGWHGEIGEELRRFLVAYEKYAESREQYNPRIKEKLSRFITEFYPSVDSAPRGLHELHVDHLHGAREYFLLMAHHQKSPDDEEFHRQLEAIELFLHNWLVGGTFLKFDQIDKLIAQGEAEGDAE